MRENRTVPMARYLANQAKTGRLSLQTFGRVYEGLRKAKKLTEGITYEHQIRHNLLLGVIGTIGLVTYAYISTHLGLPGANEVFLVAGVSGTGDRIDFGDGVIARRNKSGTGRITVPDTSIIARGMDAEETARVFRKQTRTDRQRINVINAQISSLDKQADRARIGREKGAILDRIIELQNERDNLQ